MSFQNKMQKLTSPLIGAEESQISLMNGLSINIHLMLASFYQPKGKRNKILVETAEFCSDRYALRSFLELQGKNPDDIIIQVDSGTKYNFINPNDIDTVIKDHADELALIYFGSPNYLTGQNFDL
eukprot:GHVR01127686.1.p1 GENE.GHVR01127686.1~~GHVR01127686.1.p1  ORF type:complete len:125 (+),score=12.70 GHVR01127686.1:464-838(+)